MYRYRFWLLIFEDFKGYYSSLVASQQVITINKLPCKNYNTYIMLYIVQIYD